MNRWVEGIHLAPSFYLKSDIRQARHRMQAYAVWLLKDPEKQGVVKGGPKGPTPPNVKEMCFKQICISVVPEVKHEASKESGTKTRVAGRNGREKYFPF